MVTRWPLLTVGERLRLHTLAAWGNLHLPPLDEWMKALYNVSQTILQNVNQWIVDTILYITIECIVWWTIHPVCTKVLGSQRAALKINYHLLHSHQLFQCHCEVTHVVANILSVFDNLFLLRWCNEIVSHLKPYEQHDQKGSGLLCYPEPQYSECMGRTWPWMVAPFDLQTLEPSLERL